MTINVTVWGENVHEQTNEVVARIYPDGMHHCITEGLNEAATARFSTSAQVTKPIRSITTNK